MLYMVTNLPSIYIPPLCQHIYQHHGSVMGKLEILPPIILATPTPPQYIRHDFPGGPPMAIGDFPAMARWWHRVAAVAGRRTTVFRPRCPVFSLPQELIYLGNSPNGGRFVHPVFSKEIIYTTKLNCKDGFFEHDGSWSNLRKHVAGNMGHIYKNLSWRCLMNGDGIASVHKVQE